MIYINEHISIDESELKFAFIRSSGPGGQNVNKVATAVQLFFDVQNSASLPVEVRERLKTLADSRITEQGMLVINARRFRIQSRNRQDAIERLIELIKKASQIPKKRRKRKPSFATNLRRLENKRRRGEIKRMRSYTHEF